MTAADGTADAAIASRTARLRLDYLDGLRGLCALWVVFGHLAAGRVDTQGRAGAGWQIARALLKLVPYDRYAVSIFIVLSGYCLMLPVAQTSDGTLRGGFWGYIRRRARRILPPYYAALGISLLLIALTWRQRLAYDLGWPNHHPFAPDVLLSHLFLVHNLDPRWIFEIDGPLWSVATEWQIYFIFPLLLLPLWRRFGLMVTILVAFLVGNAPHYLLHKRLDAAAPWYVGLFALGMAGAVFNFSPHPSLRRLRERTAWGILTAVLWGTLLTIWIITDKADALPFYLTEPLCGLAATCLLVYCTIEIHPQITQRTQIKNRKDSSTNYTNFHERGSGKQRSWIVRILEWRAVVWLGTFSYSIYLIHLPVIELVNLLMAPLRMAPAVYLGLWWLGVLPAVLFACWLFHLVFERPFLSRA